MSDFKKISSMRSAGKILANTFSHISEFIQDGMTARQVDLIAQSFIESQNAIPGFWGIGYQYSTCISKNGEIVHGIPSEDKLFYDGDIVSIDIGVVNGYYADAARTFLIGNVSDEAKFLVDITDIFLSQ